MTKRAQGSFVYHASQIRSDCRQLASPLFQKLHAPSLVSWSHADILSRPYSPIWRLLGKSLVRPIACALIARIHATCGLERQRQLRVQRQQLGFEGALDARQTITIGGFKSQDQAWAAR